MTAAGYGSAALTLALWLLLVLPASTEGQDNSISHYLVVQARAVDGDTVEARLDLGFGVELTGVRIRIAGVDAAETRGGDADLRAHGEEAKRYTAAWVEGCSSLVAMILDEDGGFGRHLGDLLCANRRLGADLLLERLALPYDGTVDRGSLEPEHRANAAWRRQRKSAR